MRTGLAVLAALAFAHSWAETSQVVIENAWIRAPVAGQTVTAGYCDIRNDGDEPVTIVGFTGPVRVEMHETRTEDGMARMRPLRQLRVAAKSTASLAPGGRHLMLFGVDAEHTAGEANALTLRMRLASGDELSAQFRVRAGAGGQAKPRKEP